MRCLCFVGWDAKAHLTLQSASVKALECWYEMVLAGLVKQPAVYIMASQRNGTLYTGVTSNLVQRAGQHRQLEGDGFTTRYGCTLLVWFELYADMTTAITREKQIKGGSRRAKLALVEAGNPQWRDLYPDIL